jgi:hypothetical protein
MKKYIVLIYLSCSISLLQAQSYNLDSKKLTDQYVATYKKTNPNENFFVRMSSAANNLFLVDNLPIYEAVGRLRKKSRLSVDSAVNIIFDTIIHSFARDRLWDDHPGQQNKYLPFFQMYNNRLCPCVTEKIQQLKMREDTAMNQCMMKVITDTNYVKETKRLLGHFTVNEVQDVSQLSGLYIFQNCGVVYRYFLESLRYESVYQMLENLKDWLRQLDKTLTEMYNLQSPELIKTFPSYKTYTADLKSSTAMLKLDRLLSFHNRKENTDGSVTFINTYYSYTQDKSQLYGQIIYKIRDPFFTAPILSLRFIPSAQIKDRNRYLKQIEDERLMEPPPPPPMLEQLKEIKIDTLKK